MLMDIDSDQRGAKSWAWRVLISGEQIKLPESGQRRVWIYLSWSSMIYENQRQADSCRDEPDQEALDAADSNSVALLMFYYIFAFSTSEAAVSTWIMVVSKRLTASRAIDIANIGLFLCLICHSSALCGVESWIYFPAKFQSVFSLTLGTAINLTDWLRSGGRLRSSPEAPLILSWRETKMFRSLRLELSRGAKCVNSW